MYSTKYPRQLRVPEHACFTVTVGSGKGQTGWERTRAARTRVLSPPAVETARVEVSDGDSIALKVERLTFCDWFNLQHVRLCQVPCYVRGACPPLPSPVHPLQCAGNLAVCLHIPCVFHAHRCNTWSTRVAMSFLSLRRRVARQLRISTLLIGSV